MSLLHRGTLLYRGTLLHFHQRAQHLTTPLKTTHSRLESPLHSNALLSHQQRQNTTIEPPSTRIENAKTATISDGSFWKDISPPAHYSAEMSEHSVNLANEHENQEEEVDKKKIYAVEKKVFVDWIKAVCGRCWLRC